MSEGSLLSFPHPYLLPKVTGILISVTIDELGVLRASYKWGVPHVLFLLWFLLRNMFLISMRLVECIRYYCCVIFHNLLIHSPSDGHLCCFRFWDIINKATVNVFYVSFCEGHFITREWLRRRVGICLVLVEIASFPKWKNKLQCYTDRQTCCNRPFPSRKHSLKTAVYLQLLLLLSSL